MPCVGLVVLVGSLTFVVVPDELGAPGSSFFSDKSALPLIVVDAGHGGKDEGARANGLIEKHLTLDIAHRVNQRLKVFGFPTVLTRLDDRSLSLPERAAIANEHEGSLFVSLHLNKNSTAAANGIETYYEREKVPPEAAWTWIGFFNRPDPAEIESGETLAGYVQTALVRRTEATNRGVKARDFYVVSNVRGPSVLVEAGFMSNPIEARLLANPSYRDRIAAAVVEGVMSYVKDRATNQAPLPLAKLEQ